MARKLAWRRTGKSGGALELLPEYIELALKRSAEQHTFHPRFDAMLDTEYPDIIGEIERQRAVPIPDPFAGCAQVSFVPLIANDSIHETPIG
jgi:hypothetical protein